MRLGITIFLSVAAIVAGIGMARSLAPHGGASGPATAAGNGDGDATSPIDGSAHRREFRLELVEGADTGSAEPVVVAGSGDLTVVRYPGGAEWRHTPGETLWRSAAAGYSERVQLEAGLPRWLVAGVYPSARANLQEIVEGRPGVATLGPYVDWSGVKASVASGLAAWLPPADVCGHAAVGIAIPRRNLYPALQEGEYRVWFDRARRLRLQREEVVNGLPIHGLWCRRYVIGPGAVSTALIGPPATGPALPETVVVGAAISLGEAGQSPPGVIPTRAYRLTRTWTGKPPERTLPAGRLTVFVVRSAGHEPGYVLSADTSGRAPLRMEWLHEASNLAFGSTAGMGMTTPALLGTWSNESRVQGAVWVAGGRQWVYVGPGTTLGTLTSAMKGD